MSYVRPVKIGDHHAYLFDDGFVLPTGLHPFDDLGDNTPEEFFVRHRKFNSYGAWIGDDLGPDDTPYRAVTAGVVSQLTGQQIVSLFKQYKNADYGTGEAGFAAYNVLDNEGNHIDVWLIDDASRSPEGEPPARNPQLSPGPQTMLLPEEY
jgi:hypothetical protein